MQRGFYLSKAPGWLKGVTMFISLPANYQHINVINKSFKVSEKVDTMLIYRKVLFPLPRTPVKKAGYYLIFLVMNITLNVSGFISYVVLLA